MRHTADDLAEMLLRVDPRDTFARMLLTGRLKQAKREQLQGRAQ